MFLGSYLLPARLNIRSRTTYEQSLADADFWSHDTARSGGTPLTTVVTTEAAHGGAAPATRQPCGVPGRRGGHTAGPSGPSLLPPRH